jgi:tetratricopeptide (TPR) repeat protein
MSVRDHLAIYRRKISRPRAPVIFAIAVVLCVGACMKRPDTDLVTEYSAELTVNGDTSPVVTRTLQRGEYLVEAHEHDIDAHLMVATGGAVTDLEDSVPRHGAIYQVVSLPETGELRIQVRSADHRTKEGHVILRIARWQAERDERASERVLGFATFGKAGEEIARAKTEAEAAVRAADKLHEAVAHFEAADDEPMRAQAAYSLGYVQYGPRDEWAAAVRATEIAMEAYKSSDDEAGMHNAATLRSAVEIELASTMNAGTQRAEQRALFLSADRRLAEAADFFTSHAMPLRAQYATNMRAVLAVTTAEYEKAEVLLARSIEMAQANHDVAEQARSLANLATVHNFRGFMAQAAKEYEALLPLTDPQTQPYQYAALLGNYGFTLIALGDFDRALTLHTQALKLYTDNGEQSERAIELAALGGLYLRMGDAERALQTLRAAIVEQERMADNGRLAMTLRVAATAASTLDQHDTAIGYLRKSSQIDSNPVSVARTRVLVAAELRIAGKLDEAEAELFEPLHSSNELVHAVAVEERGHLRLAQNRHDAAIADLREADRQYAAFGLEFDRIDTNTALSQALLGKGDVAGAGSAADEAIAIVTRIRASSANPEWRARFLSARYAPYEARVAAELASPDAGGVWGAFRTAEEVRARSLSDELALANNGANRPIDQGEEDLRAKLTAKQLLLESLIQRQDADEEGTIALRHSIEEARAQLDAIRVRQGGVAARQSSLPESLAQVQHQLPSGTGVLAYFVGDTSGHAWLLTRRELRHASLPGRDRLQQTVAAAVASRSAGTPGAAGERNLGSMLLGNLLDGVQETRLLVLADGPLNNVPFAALPVPDGSGVLLLDRFVLGYAPSLALAMDRTRPGKTRNTRVAVVSDPVYAADDRRLSAFADGMAGALRSAPPPSPNNLTRLPYSALEASAVTKAFGTKGVIALSGFEATVVRVLQLPSNDLAVLHFATHARARRDSPDQSALYLSEYTPDGTLLPASRLTADDISRSGLRADVVVLSGCDTGDGSALRGEGVLGLTYGFLANGSHSVVAALWPIEDASTARFMKDFYEAYRKSGRAADALRIAQLRAHGSAVTTVWSSFVVRANEFP